MHKKLLFLYLKLKIKNNHIEIIIRWKIGYRMINIGKNVATEIVTFRRIFLYYVFIQRACVRMMHGVQRIDSPFSALVLLLYTGKQPVSTTVRDNRKMYYLVSLLRFNCWQRYNDFVTPRFSKVFFSILQDFLHRDQTFHRIKWYPIYRLCYDLSSTVLTHKRETE